MTPFSLAEIPYLHFLCAFLVVLITISALIKANGTKCVNTSDSMTLPLLMLLLLLQVDWQMYNAEQSCLPFNRV